MIASWVFSTKYCGSSPLFFRRFFVMGSSMYSFGEDYLDVGIAPFASGLCGDALAVQLTLRFQTRLAVKEVLEDALHNGRFLRNHHKVVVLPFVTEDLVPEVRDAFFKALPDAPFHIVAEAGDFLLREGGVDVLLLKTNANAQLLQVPDGLQKVYRVSGKP